MKNTKKICFFSTIFVIITIILTGCANSNDVITETAVMGRIKDLRVVYETKQKTVGSGEDHAVAGAIIGGVFGGPLGAVVGGVGGSGDGISKMIEVNEISQCKIVVEVTGFDVVFGYPDNLILPSECLILKKGDEINMNKVTRRTGDIDFFWVHDDLNNQALEIFKH